MNDQEILAAVEAEEKRALGWGDGELSQERETLLRYYNQEPYGNEVEGRSQIVTSEVADTVEWILPSLLKIFTASDKAVEFDPQGPEDIEAAEQATDAVNYVFYRQNAGFVALYSFFKDALIQKNGYIKVYYEQFDKKKKEQYQGLTDDELAMLLQDKSIEVVAHTAYAVATMMGPQPEMEGQPPQAMQLHDVVIQRTEKAGQVRVLPVPPEEILVSADLNTVNVQEAPFFAHRTQKTLSDLREMGYKVDDIGSDDSFLETGGERLARRVYDEEELYQADNSTDPSMRRVWVTEAYIRLDVDGDGIAELKKVVKAGGKILETEDAEVIPFAAITPIIMTHRHMGKSVAELVADLQIIKSTVLRQTLDNVYLTNAPRMAVLASASGSVQANLDDLLTVRPGGIVREYAPGAVRPLDVPFMGAAGLEMMEYLDTVRETRTGVTRYNQGIDANSLNKTASGITQIMTASQQRIELLARIFAETGVKQLFKLILHCLGKYHGRELIIRLKDEFVAYDPRNWNTEMDLVVSVGLGTGNKDQQLMHLTQMAQAQAEAVKAGGLGKIVTLKNVFNVQAKIAENAGFKDVEEFWTDPETVPPQPPGPNPEMEKAKMEGEIEKYKADQSMQLEKYKADQSMEIERYKADQQAQAEQMKTQAETERAAIQAQSQQSIEGMRIENDAKGAQAAIGGSVQAAVEKIQMLVQHAEKSVMAAAQKTDDPQQQQALMVLIQELRQAQSETLEHIGGRIEAAMSRPKTLVRGPDGRASGVI